jgi:hypothetical protein
VLGVHESYPQMPSDRPRELERRIALALRDLVTPARPPKVRHWLLFEQEMAPMRWPVPAIATSGDLAELLGVTPGELEWLADPRRLERTVTAGRLRNYRSAWLPRASGLPRLIEQPKARLKAIQRRVLHEILDLVPSHDAAHGFRRGFSARTAASHHTGQPAVLRFDLEDFFASVEAGRVYGIFRTIGYPETVAYALTGLCTNTVPRHVTDQTPETRPPGPDALRRKLATPHLPQGAPTSPALANLCAFSLDCRLHGLALSLGAAYTRYADGLSFSGGKHLLRRAPELVETVAEIAHEEGFALNRGKTRAWRGPAAENRARVPDFRAHLLGRISWVESLNPARGARLRAAFNGIDWDA